jgi:hypothetical protein
MIELLGILGIGWGIKKVADATQSSTNRTVRSATRAVKNAPAALGAFLDQVESASGRTPLERHPDATCGLPWRPHDDEITHDDGTLTEYRCKRCKRTTRSVA